MQRAAGKSKTQKTRRRGFSFFLPPPSATRRFSIRRFSGHAPRSCLDGFRLGRRASSYQGHPWSPGCLFDCLQLRWSLLVHQLAGWDLGDRQTGLWSYWTFFSGCRPSNRVVSMISQRGEAEASSARGWSWDGRGGRTDGLTSMYFFVLRMRVDVPGYVVPGAP